MNLILSNYFTSKPDPQRGHYWKKDDFSIMETWYNSVMKHNLNAIVFHDGLSDEFIQKYGNDNVMFVRSNIITGLSSNDERFISFEQYIKCCEVNDRIIITDISDVEFLKNPFEYITGLNLLYFGSNDTWGEKPKVFKRYTNSCFDDSFLDKPILHAGTFGGYVYSLRAFLKTVVEFLDVPYGDYNINLGVINAVAYLYFKHRIVHGHPFTTQLKKYDYNNKECYIRHK